MTLPSRSAPACNQCGGALQPAPGIVPLLRCACGREVPDEPGLRAGGLEPVELHHECDHAFLKRQLEATYMKGRSWLRVVHFPTAARTSPIVPQHTTPDATDDLRRTEREAA